MSAPAGLLFAAIVLGLGMGKLIPPSLTALGSNIALGLALGVFSAVLPRVFVPGFVVATILGAGFGLGLGFTLETSAESPWSDIPAIAGVFWLLAVAGWGATRGAKRLLREPS